MTDIALRFDEVSKKFSKGERAGSLRDYIPSLTRRVANRKKKLALEKREFWALHDVSFEVFKGESFGIIGPNGAGKSTILKLLCRIMQPTRGFIDSKGTLSALIDVGAGFHPDLTGRENIYLNGAILGMKKREIERKFDEMVEFSGLADFIDTPVKRYSSGMFARLGFSVAAHVDPDVLVVDEVLSVGDYLFQRKCVEKMNSIRRSGATIIFVSHDLKSVSDLCKRTMLLEKGKAVTIGGTGEVVDRYLKRHVTRPPDRTEKEVSISKVNVRNQKGQGLPFEPGDKAIVDIELTARVRCKELSVSIYIQDENYYEIFNTSTERLNNSTFSPEGGEKWNCTFELDLHLTTGSYHLGVLVYQYNIEKSYDDWFPAERIFITSELDVRGGANLYPKLVRFEPGL